MKTKLRHLFTVITLCGYAIMLIIHSESVLEGQRQAIGKCLNVIIPSLFAFMVFSDLLIRSGLYVYVSKLFKPLAYILKIPEQLIFVFVISNLAGYPIGASLIANLYDNKLISKESASRMLSYSYNGGPAFFCGAVGLAIFNSAKIGVMIFISIIIGNILFAFFYNRIFYIRGIEISNKINLNSSMLSESIEAAGRNLFKICLMILFFQSVVTIITEINAFGLVVQSEIRTLMFSVLEISNITSLEGLPYNLLPLITACCSFGGICIILQVYTIIKNRFSILPLIINRIICSVISAASFSILFEFFGNDCIEVFSSTEVIVNFNNFIPSICLIMMIFLTVLRKRLAFSDNI